MIIVGKDPFFEPFVNVKHTRLDSVSDLGEITAPTIIHGQENKRHFEKVFKNTKLVNKSFIRVNDYKVYYFSYSTYKTQKNTVSGWLKSNTSDEVKSKYALAFTHAVLDCSGQLIKEVPYITVDDKNYKDFLAALEKEDLAFYDAETFNTEVEDDGFIGDKYINPRSKGFNVRLLGIGFNASARFILSNPNTDAPQPHSGLSNDVWEQCLAAFLKFLKNDKKAVCGHNIKYDIAVLERLYDNFNVYDIKATIYDTMVLYYVADCNLTLSQLSLKSLIAKVYPLMTNYEDGLHHKYSAKEVWHYSTYEDLARYLALDLAATEIIYYHIIKFFSKPDNKELFYHYKVYQQKALRITSHIESNGLPIDTELLQVYIPNVDKVYNWALDKLNTHKTVLQFKQKHREDFIASGGDYERYEPVDIMGNKGIRDCISFALGKNYTKEIDEFNLSKIYNERKRGKAKFEFLRYYVLAKKTNKTLNTYLRNFLDADNSFKGKRLHANLNTTITRTGRLSGSNPNLTNLSDWMRVSNPLIKQCTKAIKRSITHTGDYAQGATKERVIVEGDFKAVELVMAAFLANDTVLQQVFIDDKDPHALTAMNVKKLTQEQWDGLDKHAKKRIRTNVGKFYNFSTIFRITPNGLVYRAEMAGVDLTIDEAERDIESFFALYPNLRKWQTNVLNRAKVTEYVTTMFGFRRKLKGYKNVIDRRDRHNFEKRLVNTPIQGSAGQYMVYTLNQVKLEVEKAGLSDYVDIINTVHDSGWFSIDARPEILQTVLSLIKATAEKFALNRLKEEFGVDIAPFIPITMEFDIGFDAANFVEIGGDLSLETITNAINKARKQHNEPVFVKLEEDLAEFMLNNETLT